MSMAFHAPSFYLFGQQWLKHMYDLFDKLNEMVLPCFLCFMNARFANDLDKERSSLSLAEHVVAEVRRKGQEATMEKRKPLKGYD